MMLSLLLKPATLQLLVACPKEGGSKSKFRFEVPYALRSGICFWGHLLLYRRRLSPANFMR